MAANDRNSNFLQKTFNTISLEKDEKLWLNTDDGLTEDRLRLVGSFAESQFAAQLKLDCVSNAKNGKLSSALREKAAFINHVDYKLVLGRIIKI